MNKLLSILISYFGEQGKIQIVERLQEIKTTVGTTVGTTVRIKWLENWDVYITQNPDAPTKDENIKIRNVKKNEIEYAIITKENSYCFDLELRDGTAFACSNNLFEVL